MSDKANRRIRLTLSVCILAIVPAAAGAKTIYVDDDATGPNDGTSWASAYKCLQDALADANDAPKPVEVRVAQGIYKPDRGAKQTNGNREATFQLINGVMLKGGYAGLGAPDPNERNVRAYETVLSGDLNGDDVDVADPRDLLNEPTRADNSYHVVTGSGTDNSAVLDGFIISGGNADRLSHDRGAGMHSTSGSPTLNACTFRSNSADFGGGGMYNENSSPILVDCSFVGNWGWNGGGISNYHSSDTNLINCRFIWNAAVAGAGMYVYGGSQTLVNCIFTANSADSVGGGISKEWGGLTLANCTFRGNSARSGNALVTNWPCNVKLSNCILWDGGGEISNDGPSIVEAAYSNVQGGWPGAGNVDVDPLFADSGYWADANDPNIVVEPNDPNAAWVEGDFHLKSQAGRWDRASESWVKDDVTSPCIDAGDPNSPVGDEPEPNGGRINMGAYGGTKEASKSLIVASPIVYIQWLGHSSVKLWAENCIVYVDPQNLSIAPHDATLVLVTHSHGDHYSSSDIARVANAQTQFVAPPDVVALYGSGQTIAPGQTIESYCARLTGVAAYNTNKTNHPKSRNWVGYVIELGGKRIYVAGDTDLIDEMKSLGDIDAAILPAGGTYTMNAAEAAQATQYIKPDLAIPYHWGRVVGTLADAQTFAQLARCAVKIFAVGETIGSDNWPVYSPLIAQWTLDETTGNVADDSVGGYDGVLYGNPAWQPAGGKIDGALQLDGVDDYVGTPYVSNPAGGVFSIYAWVKGGAAGQVLISQTDGAGTGATWLGADPVQARLMTGLVPPAAGRLLPQPLVSGFVVADGQWHHVGLAWDGVQRHLYADGAEVAKDTGALAVLQSCDGGLHLGTGKALGTGTFWAGLLDDVRIYNQSLSPAELEQSVR